MTSNRLTEFDLVYADAARAVLSTNPERDARTGKWKHAWHGAHFYQMNIPLLTLRDINLKWFCAEAVWFMSAQGLNFMEWFGFKNWSKFADKDGRLTFSTGKRWDQGDQLIRVVRMLEDDPTAQRCVLDAWDFNSDLLPVGHARRKANAPCIPMVHFTAIHGVLHMSAFQRSCDMLYGFPHDIAGMSVIRDIIACKLGLRSGPISWSVSNLHFYDDQVEAAEIMLSRLDACTGGASPNPKLSPKKDWYARALAGDKSLVLNLVSQLMPVAERLSKGAVTMPHLTV